MPLFKCTGCGMVENTALCNFWRAQSRGLPAVCSKCDTDIAVWHDQFLRSKPEDHGYEEYSDGFLWHPKKDAVYIKQQKLKRRVSN